MRPYLYLKVGLIFNHLPLPKLYGLYIPLQKDKKVENMLVISLKMAETKSIHTTGHLGALQGFFQSHTLCHEQQHIFSPECQMQRSLTFWPCRFYSCLCIYTNWKQQQKKVISTVMTIVCTYCNQHHSAATPRERRVLQSGENIHFNKSHRSLGSTQGLYRVISGASMSSI